MMKHLMVIDIETMWGHKMEHAWRTHIAFQKNGDVNGLLSYIINMFGSLFMQYKSVCQHLTNMFKLH
jgi:hypothetical protein